MYTLHHGDCLDILPTLPDKSVDAIIADPPYGTTACKWDSVIPFAPMWEQLKRIIKPRGAIVLFGSQPFTSALVMSNPTQYKYSWVWEKNRGTGHLNAKKEPLQETEDINIFGLDMVRYHPQMKPGKPYTRPSGSRGSNNYGAQVKVVTINDGVRYPSNVLRYPKVERPLHPTQKPLALLEYLIKTYTNEGDTALDFTMGSGTTGEACINTGRNFIGIEKERQYYDIASKRLADAAARMVQMEIAI